MVDKYIFKEEVFITFVTTSVSWALRISLCRRVITWIQQNTRIVRQGMNEIACRIGIRLMGQHTSSNLDQILNNICLFSLMDFRPPFLFSSALISDCPTSQTNCGSSMNTSENSWHENTKREFDKQKKQINFAHVSSTDHWEWDCWYKLNFF